MKNIEDNCLLCLNYLGLLAELKSPRYCNCKVFLHTECMMKLEESGLACPICRIKMTRKLYNNWLEYPIYLMMNYPGFISFFLFIIYSFIISIIYILPMILYIYIKDKITNFFINNT